MSSVYTIAGLCHLNFVVNRLLPVSSFATRSCGRTRSYHRISIMKYIYPPRLFSRAAVISGCVNGIPIFSAFSSKGASYVEPLLKADIRASDNGQLHLK